MDGRDCSFGKTYLFKEWKKIAGFEFLTSKNTPLRWSKSPSVVIKLNPAWQQRSYPQIILAHVARGIEGLILKIQI